MSRIITGRQKILIAHVCSKCGKRLIQEFTLFTDGRANAFLHEKEKAEHARTKAYERAIKDIALCYEAPRQLGSMTEVETGEDREWAFYQIEGLEAPCSCGHVEPWQLRKKSIWNPVDSPFRFRDKIPNVPMESRPILMESQQAIDAWWANPLSAQNAELATAGKLSEKERANNSDDDLWVCFKCGTANKARVQTCQGCGVTKQWSIAAEAKKKKK